jgi:hypothetical protein
MGSQAAEGASKVGEGSQAMSLYGQMADAGGKGSEAGGAAGAGVQPVEPTSGFAMQTEGANTGQGPTVDAGNVQTYGTANPSYMQQGVNTLERFQKGSGQGLTDTYKNFGNNPETYGAVYGLATKMAGSGKPQSGAPITTNISYQQPENPYLRKRGRY